MAHSVEKVVLDVGGTRFTTSMVTLRSPYATDSWFGPRFSGQFGDDLQGESLFIDRDPTHFGKVLNFLRDGFCVLPDSLCDLRELWHEADYYSLAELKKLVERSRPMQSFFSCPEPTAGAVSERERARDMELQELGDQSGLLEDAWRLRADNVCSGRVQTRGRSKKSDQSESRAKTAAKLHLAVENYAGPRIAQFITEVLLERSERELNSLLASKDSLNSTLDQLSAECLQELEESKKSGKNKHGKGGKKGKDGKGKGGYKGKKGGKEDAFAIQGRISSIGQYDHPGRLAPSLGPVSLNGRMGRASSSSLHPLSREELCHDHLPVFAASDFGDMLFEQLYMPDFSDQDQSDIEYEVGGGFYGGSKGKGGW